MIEKILSDYITFIRSFETLLKDKYQKDINPCSFSITFFKRIGAIDGIEYYFHGSGCTAKKDEIIYTYDISINEITFTQWDLTELIRTHPEYQKLNYSNEFVEFELYKLVNKGILEWLTIEDIDEKAFGCVFKCYRIVRETFFIE